VLWSHLFCAEEGENPPFSAEICQKCHSHADSLPCESWHWREGGGRSMNMHCFPRFFREIRVGEMEIIELVFTSPLSSEQWKILLGNWRNSNFFFCRNVMKLGLSLCLCVRTTNLWIVFCMFHFRGFLCVWVIGPSTTTTVLVGIFFFFYPFSPLTRLVLFVSAN